MIKDVEKEIKKGRKRMAQEEGKSIYLLECYGDHVAEREGYKKHEGIDALHFYLIQKYHWLPSQARSLSHNDLEFVLLEEKQAWTLPEEYRV